MSNVYSCNLLPFRLEARCTVSSIFLLCLMYPAANLKHMSCNIETESFDSLDSDDILQISKFSNRIGCWTAIPSIAFLVRLRRIVLVVIVYHRYHQSPHLFFSLLQYAKKTPAICLEERKSSFLNLRVPSVFLAVLIIFDALAGSAFLPVCSPF